MGEVIVSRSASRPMTTSAMTFHGHFSDDIPWSLQRRHSMVTSATTFHGHFSPSYDFGVLRLVSLHAFTHPLPATDPPAKTLLTSLYYQQSNQHPSTTITPITFSTITTPT